MADTERWTLEHVGHHHVLEVTPSGLGRQLTWTRDGEVVAVHKTNDERVQVAPGSEYADAHEDDAGALGLRFGWFGPARRVTLFSAGDEASAGDAKAIALIGLGGVDFEPEPGSRAARRAEWIRTHPRLYTARMTAVALAGVIVPIVLISLLGRFVVHLPWPDWGLPSIPLPDLPSIPWPDLPAIPWPDISVPGWLREVISKSKYVWPVVLAFVLARAELRRRRTQDARRAEDRDQGSTRG